MNAACWSRARRQILALLAVAAIVAASSACQFARVGTRCGTGVARSRTHVLICRNHRWTNLMTFGAYARILASRPHVVPSWRTDGVGWAALKVGNVVFIGGEF